MRRILVALCVLVLFAAPAWAQDDNGTTTRVSGFVAPGFVMEGASIVSGFTPLRVGGMVEQVGSNGLGFAFDASYLTSFEDIGASHFGIIAGGLLYESGTDGPVKPYVRGGPGFLFGGGIFLHYGGGVNYWIKENFGLKVEGRHLFWVGEPRVGIVDVLVGAVFEF